MTGTSEAMDFRDFCARVQREYEDIIATIIQRPGPPMSQRAGSLADGVHAVAADEDRSATLDPGEARQPAVTGIAA